MKTTENAFLIYSNPNSFESAAYVLLRPPLPHQKDTSYEILVYGKNKLLTVISESVALRS